MTGYTYNLDNTRISYHVYMVSLVEHIPGTDTKKRELLFVKSFVSYGGAERWVERQAEYGHHYTIEQEYWKPE